MLCSAGGLAMNIPGTLHPTSVCRPDKMLLEVFSERRALLNIKSSPPVVAYFKGQNVKAATGKQPRAFDEQS
jgi:hypothetical protein